MRKKWPETAEKAKQGQKYLPGSDMQVPTVLVGARVCDSGVTVFLPWFFADNAENNWHNTL